MKRQISPRLALLCFAVIGSLVSYSTSQGIPAFARKYETSCTTCHVLPIKLNNFGQAFKQNGYRMPGGDENFIKQPEISLGAEAWKDVWPRAVWPGAVPSTPPISAQIYLDSRVNKKNEVTGAGNTTQFWYDMPHEVELIAAGTAGKGISYWANVEFKKGASDKEDKVEIVQGWGQFDNIHNTTLLNLKVGFLEPIAVPFSRVTRRFIATDFLPTEFKPVGRHDMASRQAGMELWGVQSVKETGGGFLYGFGVVNGQGFLHGDENTTKDAYARLAYKVRGLGVGRSLIEETSLKETQSWRDNSVRVGGYTYRGKWGKNTKKFDRSGLDADIWFWDLNLFGTYWRGKDDTSSVSTRVSNVKSNSWFVELDWVALPWVVGIMRYERQEQDGAPVVRRIVPAVVIGIRPNITLTAEQLLYHKATGTGNKSGDNVTRFRLRFIF